MKTWQLQEAKAKLSQLVKEVVASGPHMISVHEEPVVIVISKNDYLALTKPKTSLVEFLQQSPLKGVSLDLTRDKSADRDILL